METEDQQAFLDLIAETREHSKQICKEAAVVQERARETIRIYLLGRQRRTDAREVIPC